MALSASYYSSSVLGSVATDTAMLYQRTAYNVLNPSISTAANLGTLKNNTTQLNVEGAVTDKNPKQYYKFTLDGKNLKLSLDNITSSADLRVQILDSKGNIVADSQGTASEQVSYTLANTSIGLATKAGDYYAVVSYAKTASRINTQKYSLSLYSGSQFSESYETTAKTQNKATTYIPTDNTQTFSTYDAKLYSRNAFHTIGEAAIDGISIGWLYENKSSLNVQSQLTSADSTEFYQFTLQKGENLKMAFNNSTSANNAAKLRMQITDALGIRVYADNYGTEAQKKAFAALESSAGFATKTGTYAIKITYAPGEDKSKKQTYDFQLYSGKYYANSYETIASAETLGHALLTNNPSVGGYNAKSAIASYLTSQANGEDTDPFKIISSFI